MTIRPPEISTLTTTAGKLTAGLALTVAAFTTALAPGASAAPSDVTVSPSVSGQTITLTIASKAAEPVGCEVFGVPADTAPSAERVGFGYETPEKPGALIGPGSSKTVTLRTATGTPPKPNGSTTIPAGTYDIHWACASVTLPAGTADEYWGTTPPLAQATSTAEPVRVTVPGTAPEKPAEDRPESPGRSAIPGIPELTIPDYIWELCGTDNCVPLPPASLP
ncbi:hypothetical protein [Gordonia aurantiaca]|uniref:hypothetical protein n=1 Tax=Gordonia sp. B21 TaxID=3151852 RepID=UPI003267CB64